MTVSDKASIDLQTPICLDLEIQALRQQSLDRLAKMLADEWSEEREKD